MNGQVRQYGLYDRVNEHDACGVGLVADLENRPSHRIVQYGVTLLKNLMHRGAAGGDPETGDGAGLLFGMPDDFFRRELGGRLPEKGKYAVGMVFGGKGAEPEIEKIITSRGGRVITWRDVPVDPGAIGKVARQSMPLIRQIFVDGSELCAPEFPEGNFERRLFVMRRMIEKSVPDAYFCSFSSRSIVYKGLLLASQIEKFYSDLDDPDFRSALALVHQRYSTNTFPTWELAHPFRRLAHNGEINTLRGNLNALKSREPSLACELFSPEEMREILPLIREGQSDSASLDNMFELLTSAGRSMVHAMLMLIPQPWGAKYHLSRDVRGFFEYNSALMEPWDGPAAVGFSDGVNAGAVLDRNGLRPARYTLTEDRLFVLGSETGVIDIDPGKVVMRGRLRPGEIIFCDLEKHRLLRDNEIKKEVARKLPFRRWCEEHKLDLHSVFDTVKAAGRKANAAGLRRLFAYTAEDVDLLIKPMARDGKEPIGSMGNDAALAVLSEKPQLLFNYFKQLFAQVTNPPIDPIREELVMSLTTYIGNRGNILKDGPFHAEVLKLPRPVLTPDELARLRSLERENFRCRDFKLAFYGSGGEALERALDALCSEAVGAVEQGFRIMILSDRDLPENATPIPSLLAAAAVNRALSASGRRPECGLVIESGEVREVMHFALLIGYGATAVCPYLALETVTELAEKGELGPGIDAATAAGNYVLAVDKGLLKIMSKMGISTLRSYRSAQLFEAVGLSTGLAERYFPGTACRIGGIGLDGIAAECEARKAAAASSPELPSGGVYAYRHGGENHLWTPQSLAAFRQAVQRNDPEKYREYADCINHQEKHLCTLRGLFELVPAEKPLPPEEVESVESIVKRFVSGAMSLGSLSPEAHEAVSIAMNRLGGMSNSGEGGDDPDRYRPTSSGDDRNPAIKQIASGRFGVTIEYLRHARELQIKMAQGAKPGEGGQLPAHKVDEFIARIRHATPGLSLISPPPHHDIYSIEDLSQLIYDLHCANPKARVSVKLVSEVGVGTVAAGVAKAHADMVLISGHDGGTGASPLSSIKHAGLPWELGLAEAQQTLTLNNLRRNVRLQVDGQLKTGRDVIIGALLGAEEFGFATTILVCLGCVMMRKCHDNSCPMGVATQDPELRKRFAGKPEYIENFLRFVAEEVRSYLSLLGLPCLDAAIGRSDLLKANKAIDFYKTKNLDFSRLLAPAAGGAVRYDPAYRRGELENYDRAELLDACRETLEKGVPCELERTIRNVNRSAGAELSGEVAARYGLAGLPGDTITVRFRGCAGQSFGAFLAHGITFCLEGEANDFVGKGLSGGRIVIRPERNAKFAPEDNVIAGNVIGYGATSGEIYLNGRAGERFAVRNSGMTAVVEGVGDHGCEYMTGGRVVVLGPCGNNFAAGMTGGFAYVYDEAENFDFLCNTGTVDLENVLSGSEDERELKELLKKHVAYTGSPKAAAILAGWEDLRHNFVKVFPLDYRNALNRKNGAR